MKRQVSWTIDDDLLNEMEVERAKVAGDVKLTIHMSQFAEMMIREALEARKRPTEIIDQFANPTIKPAQPKFQRPSFNPQPKSGVK